MLKLELVSNMPNKYGIVNSINRNLTTNNMCSKINKIGIRSIHLCSLENLSIEIGKLYLYCNKNFELKSEDVQYIQDRVLSGTYRLSPFDIKLYPLSECRHNPFFTLILHCDEFPEKGVVVIASESDKLVLTALGKVLNDIFDSMGYIPICMSIHSFYDNVLLSRSNVDSLYRIDMTRSLLTINQAELISDLSSILGNNPIFDLLLSFLHADYKLNQYDGFSFTRVSIPPVCIITNVLMNYEFNKLDYAISKSFHNIDYDRHQHEVYISHFHYNKFESVISSLFDDLGLAGKMYHIKRGTDAPCFIGLVGLSNDGKIYIEYEDRT